MVNTDITCDKVTMIACHLCANANLRILDFSHCNIGDKGTAALCKLLLNVPNLAELILMNNSIGASGMELLCFTLSKPCINLKALDVHLNNFGASGAGFVARMLGANAQLARLNLSACGLSADNVMLLIEALRTNATLLHLDVSNNRLNAETGDSFASLVKSTNFTLQSLDLRMTWIPSEIVLEIEDTLDDPKRAAAGNEQNVQKTTSETHRIRDISTEASETNYNKTTCVRNTQEANGTRKESYDSFPEFHNVDELEAQVANAFHLHSSTSTTS